MAKGGARAGAGRPRKSDGKPKASGGKRAGARALMRPTEAGKHMARSRLTPF